MPAQHCRLRIAFIVTTLKATGPVIVVKNLCNTLLARHKEAIASLKVYCFDEIKENIFPDTVTAEQISFCKSIPFEQYDIIHTHMIRPDLYMLYWEKYWKKQHCKWLSTLHQDVFRDLVFRFGKLFAALVYYPWMFSLGKAAMTCCVSNTIRKHISLKNTTVVYNGVPRTNEEIHDAFIYDLLSKVKKQYKILGACGNLIKCKGFEQIVKALPLLPDMALVLLGDGIEKENLISLARDLNVDNRCFFLGFQRNGPAYYKWFDFFILSSRSEGCCQSGLEANQAGLPLICSRIEPFQEIYAPNQAAFFTLDDTSSLVAAVNNAGKNREYYAKQSKELYFKYFSAEIMTSQYLDLYMELSSQK